MFSSFVKIKSKIKGTFCDLYLVGSFTCWNRKLSLRHSKKSVEICVSFSVELVLFQLIPLMLKSPRRSKCDGFLPAISCINSKSNLVFSLVEFGLRYIRGLLFKFVDFPHCSFNTAFFQCKRQYYKEVKSPCFKNASFLKKFLECCIKMVSIAT